MAAPSGTQQLPQEKYAQELAELDEAITNLHVLYEKYFLGIDRKPPDMERKRVSEKAREMRNTSVRNTALKFKVNSLFAKLLSFERMWDRTLREIEEGTYKRDVFKASLRQKDREAGQPAAAPAGTRPRSRKPTCVACTTPIWWPRSSAANPPPECPSSRSPRGSAPRSPS